MIRKAFVTEVKPGQLAAYERRHNPIWPELEAVLKAHGLHNYSIYHDARTNRLFGYVEIEDAARFDRLAQNAVCHRWWKEMTAYLVSDRPDAPKAREDELREVFHME